MNTANEINVRPIQTADETAWREMWAAYCAFYQQSLPAQVTDSLWARLHCETEPIYGLLAANAAGSPLGFAHYVLHPHTWSEKTLCYLEDLYVSPEARGRGIGHALIEHLGTTGKTQGWGRVYWHTETGNTAARRLYDRFAPADDFVRYTITL